MKNNWTIGIIGANGKMGNALNKFFEKNLCKTVCSDLNSSLSNREVAKLSDIIVISTPLPVYENILNDIKDVLDKSKMLMDIGSLKSNEVKLMQKYFNGEILATHPLFGPEKHFSGSENNIVIYKIAPSEKTSFIINLFKLNNLNIIEMTPEEHDKIMAFIHGFYYLMNVSYIDILKNEFSTIKNLEKLKTTSFSSYIKSLENVFNSDAALISLIAYNNPYIDLVKEKFINSMNKKVDIKTLKEFLDE